MKPYNHKKIEAKWQKLWDKSEFFRAEDCSQKPKYYCLIEFPYPSGDGLHVGHVRSYTALDVMARKKRMQGFNVLYPIGWDAFGLPTENYAIKTGKHPTVITKENIKVFKKQMKDLGISFDWSREINTTDPEYYKWTQWIFLQLFKKGLAYKKKMPINWCPKCKIGLANEEVIDGECERCHTTAEKKELEQWMLKITAYADRLIDDLATVDYLEKIKTQQINWIGRSEGAEVDFKVKGIAFNEFLGATRNDKQINKVIRVFTTRPDTLFGATFLVLAPDHPLVDKIATSEQKAIVSAYQNETSAERKILKQVHPAHSGCGVQGDDRDKEKTGVFTGAYAINPVNNEEIPIWIADYVSMDYGTGAIMAVPAHDERDFEFARKYDLLIREVIVPVRIDKKNPPQAEKETVERKTVHALVRDKNGNVLCVKWKKFPWTGFVVGGVDDGEDIVEATVREVREETGYKNLKFVRVLGGLVRGEYFAAHKNENRVAYSNAVLFDLVNNEREEVSTEELEKHEAVWLDPKKINSDNFTCAELDLWFNRMNNENDAYDGDGMIINSGEYNGLSNKETTQKIIVWLEKNGLGKKSINYHLRDWVFSRQHYWGEPIPIVHCTSCAAKNEELRSKIKLSLNFRQDSVWENILSGVKTVESRALNPEEPDRYFGKVQVGDLVLGVNKNSGQELILRIKKQKIYKTLAEFFKDKETLAETFEEKFKTLAELEVAYDKLSPNLSAKANKNGLVAWEFEIVSKEVPLNEKDLPLKLPMVKKYEPTDTGKSPLAGIEKWVKTKCPKCGGEARRETDTMPNWAGSSWYFLRYIDPDNENKLADFDKLKYWLPIDLYNGGMEHTTLHLLYSRFWHKFLFDIGAVPTLEPYQKRVSHGMILAGDNQKMSKSRGNVINPDSVVADYGADALRVYEMFVGPYDQTVAWNTNGLVGVRRFLEKIYNFKNFVDADSKEAASLLQKTIQKVTDDIDNMRFNTAVSAMMIFMNKIQNDGCVKETFKKFLILLYPFAPHLAEEVWKNIFNTGSVCAEEWPKFEEKFISCEVIEIPVQINGKVRDKLQVEMNISGEEIKQLALNSEKAKKFMDGKAPKKTIYIKGKIFSIVV